METTNGSVVDRKTNFKNCLQQRISIFNNAVGTLNDVTGKAKISKVRKLTNPAL